MLPDAILVFHVAPYLTLYDVVIFISTCKRINRLPLLKNVDAVVVPECNIIRFMRNLTIKCPNVTKLQMKIFEALSGDTVQEINQLPLVSFTCVRCKRKTCDYENLNTITKDGEFNLPKLTYLHVNSFQITNSPDLEDIRLENVSGHTYDLSKLSNLAKLKKVSIEGIRDNAELDIKLYKLPVSKIRMPFANKIEQFDAKTLKSLHISRISKLHSAIGVIQTLRKFQLRELSIPYIDRLNEVISSMPLEILIVRGTGAGDIHLHHNSIRRLSVNVNGTIDMPNLVDLRLDTCVLKNTELPSIKRLDITRCNLPEAVIGAQLTSLNMTYTLGQVQLRLLPVSLQKLVMRGVEADYTGFPLLPHLTKLHITEKYYEYEDYEDIERTNYDYMYKRIIPDEVWRTIAQSPITNFKFAGASLHDGNIHYFAETPINYLNIKFTHITAAGMMTIKKLPLRQLLIPKISAHHLIGV